MTRSAWFLLLVAACGGDAAPPAADAAAAPDAEAPDAWTPPEGLACLGQPPPATAPEPVAIGGSLFAVEQMEVTALAGVPVELRARDGGALIASATTDGEGRFEIAVDSGGAPVDGYFSVEVDGYLPTRAFPAFPLTGAENALLIAAGAEELGRWYAQAGDVYQAPERTVIAAVADCAIDSIEGATARVTPAPSTLTYYDDVAHAWDPALDASTNGFALATGAAAEVTITGAIGSVDLPARAVPAAPGELTLVVATPHAP